MATLRICTDLSYDLEVLSDQVAQVARRAVAQIREAWNERGLELIGLGRQYHVLDLVAQKRRFLLHGDDGARERKLVVKPLTFHLDLDDIRVRLRRREQA